MSPKGRAVAVVQSPKGRTTVIRNPAKRRKKKFTLPLAVVAGFVPPIYNIYQHSYMGFDAGVREMGRIFLGFDRKDGSFNWEWMRWGTLPILAGLLVHWAVGKKLGVNRALARAGIPVIRL